MFDAKLRKFMIQCPKCQKSLPDWAQQCQFCGADTKAVARPVPVQKVRQPMSTDALKWVFPVYYTISGWWILRGVISILSGVGVFGEATGTCDFIIGGFGILLGLGLILRLEIVRGVVNVLSFLKILSGAWGAWVSFVSFPILGGIAAIGLILNVIDIVTGAFMIFLIGETDKAAPNI